MKTKKYLVILLTNVLALVSYTTQAQASQCDPVEISRKLHKALDRDDVATFKEVESTCPSFDMTYQWGQSYDSPAPDCGNWYLRLSVSGYEYPESVATFLIKNKRIDINRTLACGRDERLINVAAYFSNSRNLANAFLSRSDADLNVKATGASRYANGALLEAIYSQHYDFAMALAQDPRVNLNDEVRTTPLIETAIHVFAKQRKATAMFKTLLARPDLNLNQFGTGAGREERASTPLACENPAEFELLIMKPNYDINLKSPKGGLTDLMIAAARCDSSKPVAQILKRPDLDVNARSFTGKTALTYAEESGNSSAARLIRSRGGTN